MLNTMAGTARWTGLMTASVAALVLAACSGDAPPVEDRADARLDASAADAPPAAPVSAPAKSPEAESPGAKRSSGDLWQKRLNQVEQGLTVQQQESQIVAQRLVEQALALKREFKYAQALDTVRLALKQAPDHPEARSLEIEIGTLLDQYPNREKAYGTFVKNELQVRAQQTETEIDNHIEKGKRYLADRQYAEALSEFERAEEKLEAIPYDIALKQRLTEVKALARKTRDEQAASLQQIEAENRQKAMDEAAKEEERRRNEVISSVRVLLQKAIENFEQKHYDRCAELCDEILIVDPHYRAAVDLRDHAWKARHRQEYADYLTARIIEWKRVCSQDDEAQIPYADSLRFPDAYTWSKISKRISAVSAAREESAIDSDVLAIKNKLDNLKIELDFQEAGLEDVVEFIRQFSGISIVVDQAVRGDSAIMDKKISFKVKDLVLANVLKLLLSQYGLAYTFKEKVLYITMPDKIGGESVLGLHDVRDLLVKVSDNPGPVIELRPPSAAAGGLAGATFTLEEPRTPGIGEEQIVNLVQENVMPGTWEGGGHSISLTPNQQLLVNHTAEAHREVRQFLTKLRQYAGSMVSIESRFIAAHDNFLEDVGLDIRGLQDVGGPISPTTGAQISTSASATTPPTVVDFNDRTGQNEPGFITNESARAENYDLRFRTIGSFLADLGPGGTLIADGGTPGYILGNRLTNRGGLGLEYFFLGEQELSFVLRAVRKSEKAVIVTAPRVTVFNTQRSNVFVATQRAYIQDFDVEVTTLAFALDPIIGYVQDGIVLDVRPIISNDRRYVTMELRTTFADFQGFRIVLIDPPINAILQLPFLVLEKAETTVRLPDRGTLLISGFRDILSRDLYATVPFLGDLPIINFFFSRKAKGIEKRKLFILVSAEIIDLGEHLARQKEPPQ